jgi:hypothetical protein
MLLRDVRTLHHRWAAQSAIQSLTRNASNAALQYRAEPNEQT